MGGWGLSCAYAAFIFAIGSIGGAAPVALRNSRSKKRDRFLSLGSLFGAGVFLSAGFVHLLGDAAGDLDDGYPWAMLVSSSTLILTMLIEKVVLSLLQTEQHPFPVEQSTNPALSFARNEEEAEEAEEAEGAEEVSSIDVSHSVGLQGDSFTAVVMFAALSFHSFLAGLSLGADPEGTAVFIAIMAHKGFAAFALGTNFVRARAWKSNEPIPSKTILAWMIIFSLVTPVGVLIGTAVQEADESVATAVITAAAAGTFIYVALAEVAIPELERPGNPLEKTACVVAGYSLMSLLAIWV